MPSRKKRGTDPSTLAGSLANLSLKDDGPDHQNLIVGVCKCGSCRLEFPKALVCDGDSLTVVNCHCERCRRSHAAAFASYVVVQTSGLQNLKGYDAVCVRSDKCGSMEGSLLRAFCGKCFASMATFQKVGSSVRISAGCLDTNLHNVKFEDLCEESGAPYLGFVPNKKKQKELRVSAGRSKVTGGCGCGSCRFSLKKLPEEFQHCYCSQCRRLSGAAWQTWMPVEDGQMKWVSTDGLKLLRTTSHARRHLCTHCGVFLTIVYDEDGAVWPLAGALDDSYAKDDLYARVSDVSHICVKWKQPWLTLPKDGLQRIQEAC